MVSPESVTLSVFITPCINPTRIQLIINDICLSINSFNFSNNVLSHIVSLSFDNKYLLRFLMAFPDEVTIVSSTELTEELNRFKQSFLA